GESASSEIVCQRCPATAKALEGCPFVVLPQRKHLKFVRWLSGDSERSRILCGGHRATTRASPRTSPCESRPEELVGTVERRIFEIAGKRHRKGETDMATPTQPAAPETPRWTAADLVAAIRATSLTFAERAELVRTIRDSTPDLLHPDPSLT